MLLTGLGYRLLCSMSTCFGCVTEGSQYCWISVSSHGSPSEKQYATDRSEQCTLTQGNPFLEVFQQIVQVWGLHWG